MPAGGIDLTAKEKLLSTSEIVQIASLFVEEGVDKIRLTGGEPSIRPDIIELVGKINVLIYLSLTSLYIYLLYLRILGN